jgi:hypothetical protein
LPGLVEYCLLTIRSSQPDFDIFFALDEGRTVFIFIGFRDCVDGQTGMIQDGIGCDVAQVSIIILNQMCCKAGLADVN